MRPHSIFRAVFVGLLLLSLPVGAQIDTSSVANNFWSKVRFGGGVGANFGNNFTSFNLSPAAIYEFNDYIATGLSASYTYYKEKRFSDYRYDAYGGSVLFLVNPIREIQLSAELEGMQVDASFTDGVGNRVKDNFFQESLFLGAGFRTRNVVVGVRYNLLRNKNRDLYGSAWMPFVRVFF